MASSVSVGDVLRELDEKGKVKLVIEFTKKEWMNSIMLRLAIEQARNLGVDIRIAGVEKV